MYVYVCVWCVCTCMMWNGSLSVSLPFSLSIYSLLSSIFQLIGIKFSIFRLFHICIDQWCSIFFLNRELFLEIGKILRQIHITFILFVQKTRKYDLFFSVVSGPAAKKFTQADRTRHVRRGLNITGIDDPSTVIHQISMFYFHSQYVKINEYCVFIERLLILMALSQYQAIYYSTLIYDFYRTINVIETLFRQLL